MIGEQNLIFLTFTSSLNTIDDKTFSKTNVNVRNAAFALETASFGVIKQQKEISNPTQLKVPPEQFATSKPWMTILSYLSASIATETKIRSSVMTIINASEQAYLRPTGALHHKETNWNYSTSAPPKTAPKLVYNTLMNPYCWSRNQHHRCTRHKFVDVARRCEDPRNAQESRITSW